MLVDVVLTGAFSPRRIQQGLYEGGWNFELWFRGRQIFERDFPGLPDGFNCYGVCDSPEQLLARLPAQVKDGPERYAISMVRLLKSAEPPEGGWRWHKWGPYIGDQKPQCEYLAHEPEIQEVWAYHVYDVGDVVPAGEGGKA